MTKEKSKRLRDALPTPADTAMAEYQMHRENLERWVHELDMILRITREGALLRLADIAQVLEEIRARLDAIEARLPRARKQKRRK